LWNSISTALSWIKELSMTKTIAKKLTSLVFYSGTAMREENTVGTKRPSRKFTNIKFTPPAMLCTPLKGRALSDIVLYKISIYRQKGCGYDQLLEMQSSLVESIRASDVNCCSLDIENSTIEASCLRVFYDNVVVEAFVRGTGGVKDLDFLDLSPSLFFFFSFSLAFSTFFRGLSLFFFLMN